MLSADIRLEISELLATASYAYDERDLEMLEGCLHPEAVMSLRIAGGDLVGPFEGLDCQSRPGTSPLAGQRGFSHSWA